jgi:hypothetical protein
MSSIKTTTTVSIVESPHDQDQEETSRANNKSAKRESNELINHIDDNRGEDDGDQEEEEEEENEGDSQANNFNKKSVRFKENAKRHSSNNSQTDIVHLLAESSDDRATNSNKTMNVNRTDDQIKKNKFFICFNKSKDSSSNKLRGKVSKQGQGSVINAILLNINLKTLFSLIS